MDFPRTPQEEIRRPRQDENGKEQACGCRCSVKVTTTHSDRRPGFSSRLCFADFSRGIRDKEGGDASGIWRKGGRQHDRAEFFVFTMVDALVKPGRYFDKHDKG